MKPNVFCHIELQTPDPAKAREFYSKLFPSWQFEDHEMPPMGTYTMLNPGGPPNGGLMKLPMPGAPVAWQVYVDVEDIDRTLAMVPQLGGNVIVPKMPIPNVGQFAFIQDPTGAVIGLWEMAPKK